VGVGVEKRTKACGGGGDKGRVRTPRHWERERERKQIREERLEKEELKNVKWKRKMDKKLNKQQTKYLFIFFLTRTKRLCLIC
jgi:hypothetical protein